MRAKIHLFVVKIQNSRMLSIFKEMAVVLLNYYRGLWNPVVIVEDD